MKSCTMPYSKIFTDFTGKFHKLLQAETKWLQLVCVIPPFETIICTRTYEFTAASLTVHQLAKRMLPGPISLRWHLASPPTRFSPNQE